MTRRRKTLRRAGNWMNLSVVGLQFPVAILIGYFCGKWLDGLFGTWPYLTGVFSLFGIAAGFVNLFRMTARAAQIEEQLAMEETETTETDQEAPASADEEAAGESARGDSGGS